MRGAVNWYHSLTMRANLIHLVIFYYIWVRIIIRILSAVANGVVKGMQELKPQGDRSAVRELMKIVDL